MSIDAILSNGWLWLAFWAIALTAVGWLHVQHATYGINLSWRDLPLLPSVLLLGYAATRMHTELWPSDVEMAWWTVLFGGGVSALLAWFMWTMRAPHVAAAYAIVAAGLLAWFLGVIDTALAETGGLLGTIAVGLILLVLAKEVFLDR